MADPTPNPDPTPATAPPPQEDPDAAHRDAQRRMVAALFCQQPHPALRRPLAALPPYADDAAALSRARAARRALYGGCYDDEGDDLPEWWHQCATVGPHPQPSRSLWPCAPQPCNANANRNTTRPPFLQGGLLAASAGATTTDHREQAAANLLTDAPDRFWSSRGEAVTLPDFPPEAASEERLSFVLADAGGGNGAAVVGGVTLRAYRATFQPGHPVYPPLQVQIWLGASLASLSPAGPWLPFWPSAKAQSFPVAAAAVAGGGRSGGALSTGARVLQVRLRGRPQWQLEDLRFYVALQYCGASGLLLPPATPLPSPAARAASAAALKAAADDGTNPSPLLRWHRRGRVLRFRGGQAALVDRTENGRQRRGRDDADPDEDEGYTNPRDTPLAAALRARSVCVCQPRAPPSYAEVPPPSSFFETTLCFWPPRADRLRDAAASATPSIRRVSNLAFGEHAWRAARRRHAVSANAAFWGEREFWLPSRGAGGGGGGGCSCHERAYGPGSVGRARAMAAVAALAGRVLGSDPGEEEGEVSAMEEEREAEPAATLAAAAASSSPSPRGHAAAAALVDASLAPFWPIDPPPRRSRIVRVPLESLFSIQGGGCGSGDDDDDDEGWDEWGSGARADAEAAEAWAAAVAVAAAAGG